MLNGIDVSNFQGAFNWNAYRGKISFGAVQVTDGPEFFDPDFPGDWAAMKSIGIARFAYHYARPGESSPQQQAAHLIDNVTAAGLDSDDHYILDLETSCGLPAYEVTAWAHAFCQIINSTGHRCLVYTYPAFAEAGNCATLASWHLWVADYGVSGPTVPEPWSTWLFWQSSGSTLDTDKYNGDSASLDKFMRRG